MTREEALVGYLRGGGRGSWLPRLEARLGPLAGWWDRRAARLLEAAGLPRGAARKLADRDLGRAAAEDLVRLRDGGWRVLPQEELGALADLPEPPVLLFARGRDEVRRGTALAVVGARRATGYGLRVAGTLSRGVAARGVVIVSGLARGIDTAAHEAALSVGGATLAVLGCGPDVAYPPENGDLLLRIAQEGLVVTEHPPGTPPRPGNFPRRNRILVGLADALLLVEARLRSGSLTSVRWAADLGRDVLVVPGPVDAPLSEAPLALLREGCTPVGTADHVLEALGLPPVGEGVPLAAAPRPLAVDAAASRLLALLGAGGLDLDELVRLSGEAPGRVLATLLGLEVRGLVRRGPGTTYEAVPTTGAPGR